MNYYNENDPKAAAWLRELINQKLIPAGHVDTRSITDVRPDDVRGYTQCHFFCGIGGWSYALQLAGWPEDRPVWTGSCPCQPFSTAGKGLGAADERHLWPAFFDLIRECRPERVFGEQVASAIGKGWLDGISADLGAEGYACGSAVLGAHSLGAPHIRQRLYWVAYSPSGQCEELWQGGDISINQPIHSASCDSTVGGMADPISTRKCWGDERGLGASRGEVGEPQDGKSATNESSNGCEDALRVAHTESVRLQEHGECKLWGASWEQSETGGLGNANHAGCPSCNGVAIGTEERPQQPANPSAWGDSTSIPCRDGKQRRIPSQDVAESVFQYVVDELPCSLDARRNILRATAGFPLSETIPGRVTLLRGAGNAIVPQVAAEFIMAFNEIIEL